MSTHGDIMESFFNSSLETEKKNVLELKFEIPEKILKSYQDQDESQRLKLGMCKFKYFEV